MIPGGLANDDLNASTAQSRSMLDSVLGIRSEAHGAVRISHCQRVSLMKSSECVRMLEKIHMESADTFDLKVYPSRADLRAACGTTS
jgi:hypothetical protein